MRLKSLELFCGTKSFTKSMLAIGASCIAVDNDPRFEPDICVDILTFTKSMLPRRWCPDVIWASPPCTGFSNAAGGKYWSRARGWWEPVHPQGPYYLKLVYATLKIIRELKPRYWFVENPVSLLRNLPVLWGYPRQTITYCQYGQPYRKPTDIWTNCDIWIPRLACHRGDNCHEYVKHQTHIGGVSRLSGPIARGIIPTALCDEIVKAIMEVKSEATQG